MDPTPEGLLPLALSNWIKAGNCVAFVGAGFTMPLGFPSWKQLMTNLVEYSKAQIHSLDERRAVENAERYVAAGNLPAAAGEIRELLTRTDFSVFINRQFSTREREAAASDEAKERMRLRLRSLVSVPWAGIVTTNFDDYIRADRFDWRAHGNDPDLGHILSRREPFLIKLHSGKWASDVVLTNEDYYETYLPNGRSSGVREFLKALMLSHQIVFIGSSLEDRLLDVRRELYQSFKGHLPNAWALVPETNDLLARKSLLLRDHQVQLITYPIELPSQPDHWCVDRFLELAAECSHKPAVS